MGTLLTNEVCRGLYQWCPHRFCHKKSGSRNFLVVTYIQGVGSPIAAAAEQQISRLVVVIQVICKIDSEKQTQ